MAHTGTAETAAPAVEEIRAPGPAPLGPDDRVPLFRSDLVVVRGADPGLFDVEDPNAGRRFTLYEFELAVGRMLDGHRTVAEVVANGVRLGIPVDVPGLNQFVRQMWNYGFLHGEGEAPAPGACPVRGGTWPERKVWDEGTRSLFQTGLRLVRAGRGADARAYFEAVLDSDPENPEARELIALLDAGHALAAAPLGGPRPGAAPSARRRRLLVVAGAALAAAAAGALVALAFRPPHPAAPPVAPAASPTPEQATRATFPATPAPLAARASRVEHRVHPAPAQLLAPAAGRLSRGPDPARPVPIGEPLARVVDSSRWWLTVSLAAAPPEGAACEVLGDLPARRAPCRVVARTAAGDRFEVVADVAAKDAPWLAGAAAPVVRLGPPPSAAEDGPLRRQARR